MRILAIATAIVIMAGCGVKEKDKREARIDLPGSVVYEFPTAKPGDLGEHKWRVYSVGNIPLTLRLKEKSCSCTDINLSKTNDVSVAPGKYFDIVAKWKVQSAEKHFSGVKIFTNDPKHNEFALMIQGPVELSAEQKKVNAERQAKFTEQMRKNALARKKAKS